MNRIAIPAALIRTREAREAEAQAAIRAKFNRLRNERFEATRWLVERHAEELAQGVEPTLSDEQHKRVLAYRQALRDLPVSTDPEWPVLDMDGQP